MSRLARDSGAQPIQCLRPGATQTVSVSGSAASSTSITQRVTRIVATVDVHISVSGSFITGGSTGTAYVSEMI
jgi:hypothetical protein